MGEFAMLMYRVNLIGNKRKTEQKINQHRQTFMREGLRGRARCVAPRAFRRRERCLFEARFGRWPLAWRKIWAVTMFDLAV